jgi:hypothetical protein
MHGGELFDRLIRRGAYSEDEARVSFAQFAKGLAYLHRCVLWHGGTCECASMCTLCVSQTATCRFSAASSPSLVRMHRVWRGAALCVV